MRFYFVEIFYGAIYIIIIISFGFPLVSLVSSMKDSRPQQINQRSKEASGPMM